MAVTIKSAREIEFMREAGRILAEVHEAFSYTHLDVYKRQVVKPGRVMFEIAGVPDESAKEALRLAMHKLPCKCKIVSKADLEGGVSNEN